MRFLACFATYICIQELLTNKTSPAPVEQRRDSTIRKTSANPGFENCQSKASGFMYHIKRLDLEKKGV